MSLQLKRLLNPGEVPDANTLEGEVVLQLADALIFSRDTEGNLVTFGGGNTGPVDWSDIINKPLTFPSEPTDWADITNKPLSFPVVWTDITSKPTSFPTTWGDVSGKPTSFTPDEHNHPMLEITGLQDALDAKLNATTYTASDILTKIKTVDGASSGLDADLLDGQDGSYYRNATNLNAGTVPTARLGSGTANSTTVLFGNNVWGTISSVSPGGSFEDSFTTTPSYYNGTSTIIDCDALAEGTRALVSGAGSNSNYPGIGFWHIETVRAYVAGTKLQRAWSYNQVGKYATRNYNGTSWSVWLVVDQAAFDGRVSVAGDAMTGTLDIDVGGGAASTVPSLQLANGSHKVSVYGWLGAGSYNPGVQSGDTAFIFDRGTQGTGALFIGPWASTNYGLRMEAGGAIAIKGRPTIGGTAYGSLSTNYHTLIIGDRPQADGRAGILLNPVSSNNGVSMMYDSTTNLFGLHDFGTAGAPERFSVHRTTGLASIYAPTGQLAEVELNVNGALAGGIFADGATARAVVYAGSAGYVSLRPNTRGTTTNEFKVSTTDVTWTGANTMFKSDFLVDCSGAATNVFKVLQPGSTPVGSYVMVTSPGSVPGFVAQYSTTKRRDIQFTSTGIFFGASTSTAGPTVGVTIGEDGGLTADGSIASEGTAYWGDAKEIIRFSDAWLRLNPATHFASGIYAGTGLFRTDGSLQVGTSSTAGFYCTTTVAPQWKGLELGYRSIPLTLKNAAYTFVADDAGKGVYHSDATARTYTVPPNVFSIGDVITVVNYDVANVTLAQGAGVALYMAGTTGATSGNRTIGTRGIATIICVASNSFFVTGVGVS